MTQDLTNLFGENANRTDDTITINLNDFVDQNGNPYLAAPTTATPAQAATAWIAWLHHSTKEELDENSQPIVDKTQAIVAQTNFQPKTFEVRENTPQVRHNFDFAVYANDSAGFDPDDVI